MFNEKDILARLQNGEDAQFIADEFAKLLNSANKTYAEEQKKAEAEARAKQIQQEKEKELAIILEDLECWMRCYYPKHDKIIAQSFDENSTKDVIASIDAIFGLIDFDFATLFTAKSPVAKKTAENAGRVTKSADDVINDFLKSVGW